MKKQFLLRRSFGLILSVVMIMSMLPLATITASAKDIELSGSLYVGIPELKVGEKPWTDIGHPEDISEGIYVSDIVWIDKGTDGKSYNSMDKNSLLERGHIYSCHIYVKTLPGYKIKDVEYRDDYNNRRWTNSTNIYVNGHSQESENNGEDIYPVKDAYGDDAIVIFPRLKEPARSVTVEVDEPYAGDSPDFTPEISHGEYSLYSPEDLTSKFTNGISWWDKTENKPLDESSVFIEGHEYEVLVGLKVNFGCEVDGIGAFDVPNASIGYHSATASHYLGSEKDKADIVILTYDYAPCTKKIVSTIEIKYLEKPRPGCHPDFRVGYYGDEGYEPGKNISYPDGIAWLDMDGYSYMTKDDVFEEGHEYSCKFLVKAEDRYSLATTSDGKKSTVYAKVDDKVCTPGAYSGYDLKDMQVISVYTGVCEYEIISEVGVNDLDTRALPGRHPDYDATVQGSAYTYGYSYKINTDTWRNGIHWSDSTDNNRRLDPDSETFVEGRAYSVSVDIVPQPGFKLAVKEDGKSDVKAKINGKTASVSTYQGTNADEIICISCYTDKCETYTIGGVSVSGIEEPVAGYTPVFSAVADDPDIYHVFTDFATETSNTYAIDGVSWYDRNTASYLTPSDKFRSGHSYTCAVYLLPNTGCTFPSKTDDNGVLDIKGTLNGRNAGNLRNNIGRLMDTGGVLVSYTFKVGEYTPMLYTFSADDIVYPRPGKKPSYTATPGKFTKLCTDHHSADMFNFYDGVMWYDKTESRRLEQDDTFIEGHDYSVDVVLETTNGCQFNFTDEETSRLDGTVGGNAAYGFPITSKENERRLYLIASADVGVCEKYSGPETIVSKVDLGSVVMPVADETAQFKAVSLTEGVYVDTSYSDEKFHNGVSWVDMTEYHALEVGEKFVDEHYYQLSIIYKADEGFRFSQSGGVSNVYTYINEKHESSMNFGENDSTKTRLAYASCKCLPQETVYNITVKGGSASKGGNTAFWAKYGETLTLQCSNTISAYFDHWECSDDLVDITNIYAPVTSFTMPEHDVTFTAVANEPEPEVYNITVIGGRALDKDNNEITSAEFGTKVRLSYNAPQNKSFVRWEADSNSIDIDDINSSETAFLMPKHDVTITAVEQSDEPSQMYDIMVINGKATDVYFHDITSASEGDMLHVLWNSSPDKTFDHWECDDSSVTFDDITSSAAVITMPANNITVTAVEKETPPEEKYSISIIGGTAFDESDTAVTEARKGDKIAISWNAAEGREFAYWDIGTSSVTLTDSLKKDTTFIMPAENVTLKAIDSEKATSEEFCNVTYLANDGTLTSVVVTVKKNTEITLPECMFTPPEGKEFFGWMLGNPGEKLMITEDTFVWASWKDKEDYILTDAGCTVKLPVGGESPSFTAQPLDEEKYTVTVNTWYLDDSTLGFPTLTSEDKFEGGKDYRVRVYFEPKAGHKFDENTKFTINHEEAYRVGDNLYEVLLSATGGSSYSGIYGDVDRDTLITANDALMILRKSVNLDTFDSEQTVLGDVDIDSSISANDALAVLRYSVGVFDDNLVGKHVTS